MAITDVSLRIGADPTNLTNGLRNSTAAVNSFASKTRASISRLGAEMRGVMDRALTPLTGLMLGGGLGLAIKQVGDLSNSLMYYQFTAGKTDTEITKLRGSIHDLAVETGYSASVIQDGVSQMAEFTGDIDFSEGFINSAAKIARASNSTITDIASVGSSLKSSLGLSADEATKIFNMLIAQGDRGAYALNKMSQEGRALIANASTYGVRSTDQLAGFMAILQTANSSIKSESELTTAISRMMDDLISKQKELGKMGIKVFDKDGARDFETVVREIIEVTGGDLRKLGDFGASSQKLLRPLILDYQNGWKQLNDIKEVGLKAATNTDEIDKRFARTRDDFKTNMQRMYASAVEFADTNLAGPVEKLSDVLKYLSENQKIVERGFKAIAVAATAMAAVKVGGFVRQIGTLAKDIKGIWSGKNAPAASAAIDAVQKVFVVNMGGGGLGGGNTLTSSPAPLDTWAWMGDSGPAKAQKELVLWESEWPNLQRAVNATGKAFNTARVGVNRFGNTLLGGSALTMATSWAIGKIQEFGSAFMEWRSVVAETNKQNREYIASQSNVVGDRYGSSAGRWSKKYDDALLKMAEEENSFLPSQKKINEYAAEIQKYRNLMNAEIRGESGKQYADRLNQEINIYVDPQKRTAVVETSGNVAKPPRANTLPGAC
jgi:TP901 family phage tail tape measure protein